MNMTERVLKELSKTPDTLTERIAEALSEHPDGLTSLELASITGANVPTIAGTALRMMYTGRLKRVGERVSFQSYRTVYRWRKEKP